MIFSSFVLFLSLLSLTFAEKCGEATLTLKPRGSGRLRVSLRVVPTGAPPPFFSAIGASVFWYNAATDTSGSLSTSRTSPTITENTYSYVWDVTTGNGIVQVGVPVLQAFTSTAICYVVFPTETIVISSAPRPVVTFPKQNLQFQVGDDVVWVIDSTGSMKDNIEDVRQDLNRILDFLDAVSKSYRVAIVQYNDPNAGIQASIVLPFSSDVPDIRAAIAGLGTRGGGDTPEHVYTGIFIALFLPWRPGARRTVIVLGDAPAKDPEPGTGLTRMQTVELANSINVSVNPDPVVRRTIRMERQRGCPKTIQVPYKGLNPLFMIPIGDGSAPIDSFKALAKGTGGKVFRAKTASGVSKAIIKAIRSSIRPQIAVEKLAVRSYCWRGLANHRIMIENANAFDVPFKWLTKADGEKITGSGIAAKSTITTTDILFPRLGKYVVKVTWKDRGRKRSAKVRIGRSCYCIAFNTSRFCTSRRMFGKHDP